MTRRSLPPVQRIRQIERFGHPITLRVVDRPEPDARDALRAEVVALGATEPAWAHLREVEVVPQEAGWPRASHTLKLLGVPRRERKAVLAALRVASTSSGLHTLSRVRPWPATNLADAWARRRDDGGSRVLTARVAFERKPLPRSPFAVDPYTGLVGLHEVFDQAQLLRRRAEWTLWDPGAVVIGDRFGWLWPDPIVTPPVEVLKVTEPPERWAPWRVTVPADAPEYAAHRAAVLAAARAEDRYNRWTRDEGRLEGVAVPWRIFRETYDEAAGNPVLRRSPYATRSFTHATWPRPRKPRIVYRWSGLWNAGWRHGYDWWGCQIWSVEWREPGPYRVVQVIVDVQTD
ncbi:MAG: hypothetical protein H6739_07620 [Alphaproteobacteria bacterium]|nr:hypothetical protein [Alphaproteobacteria bacterium]